MTDERIPTIEFKLEGLRQDDGLVRVGDFLGFLANALTALRRIQAASVREGDVDYRIVNLEIGSALVAIQPFVPDGQPSANAALVATRFAEAAAALHDRTLRRSGADAEIVNAFRDMLVPLRQNRLRGVSISIDGTRFDLLHHHSERALFVDSGDDASASVGSFVGYVDAINVHREPVFYLYPPLGPTKISCSFDRALIDEIRGALKRYVTVYGLAEYAMGSVFPSNIAVDRVEIHPSAEDLPTLRSLWATAPDLTSGEDSVAFVRRGRDAEE